MEDSAGLIVLVGRILFALFFLRAGIAHIRNSKMMEGYASSMKFPVPAISGWPTGVWLIAGSLSLGLGIWPDLGALMIAAFLIPAAIYFHRYWEVEASQRMLPETQLWRNVIGVGACLVMFATFASLGEALRYSITESLFSF